MYLTSYSRQLQSGYVVITDIISILKYVIYLQKSRYWKMLFFYTAHNFLIHILVYIMVTALFLDSTIAIISALNMYAHD